MIIQIQLNGIVFEWIPYNQFNEIKEKGKNDFTTVFQQCGEMVHYI